MVGAPGPVGFPGTRGVKGDIGVRGQMGDKGQYIIDFTCDPATYALKCFDVQYV